MRAASVQAGEPCRERRAGARPHRAKMSLCSTPGRTAGGCSGGGWSGGGGWPPGHLRARVGRRSARRVGSAAGRPRSAARYSRRARRQEPPSAAGCPPPRLPPHLPSRLLPAMIDARSFQRATRSDPARITGGGQGHGGMPIGPCGDVTTAKKIRGCLPITLLGTIRITYSKRLAITELFEPLVPDNEAAPQTDLGYTTA